MYGPLSSLATIILNDAQTQVLYLHDNNIQTDPEEAQCDEDSDRNDGDDVIHANADCKKEFIPAVGRCVHIYTFFN